MVLIKVFSKEAIVQQNKQDKIVREKTITKQLQGLPFIIQLRRTFMTEDHLYFIFEQCKYGSLHNLIKKEGKLSIFTNSLLGRLSEQVARLYTAQLVQGIENMHAAQVMHRDLKPENICIDEDLHIKIVSPT